MEHRAGDWAPVRTSGEVGTEISADLVVQTPYDRLWQMLDDVFPYDWRADIRHNAKLLNEHLAANPAPAGQRWTLVGHSQGCLVILAASKLESAPHDFATRVQRVILVAPPVAGTMRAANPLLFGFADLGAANQLLTRLPVRTWPALYQMLPSWNCVVGTNARPRPSNEQLVSIGGWTDTSDVDLAVLADMLERAIQFQALLAGPFSYMGPWIDARVVLGEGQGTPVTIVRDGATMFPDRESVEPGDTLVPEGRSVAWGGAPFGAHVTAIDDAREHAFLCEDEDVLTLIRRWIREPAPDAP
jgi:pimeloyl-ACP methyl ester carboxylesterase